MDRSIFTAPLRERARSVARSTAEIALKGVPALRAALHGARLGAGRAFAPSTVHKLGVEVLPAASHVVADALARTASEGSVVLARGGRVLRAGAHELVVHTREGLQLRLAPTGARAAATEGAVLRIAGGSARSALRGIGRATVQGAAAGAVLDGVIAGTYALRAMRRGEMDRASALRHVGTEAARGAVIGAVGVAAAGAVSAIVVATGFTLVGAPVVIPLATMVTAGALAGRAFDHVRARWTTPSATIPAIVVAPA